VLAARRCDKKEVKAGPTGHVRFEGQRSRVTGTRSRRVDLVLPDGSLRERGKFEDGRRVGVWSQWWSNGARRSEGLRVWDEETRTSPREGAWTFWHPNGALASRGLCRGGKREGWWEFSLDDGRLDTGIAAASTTRTSRSPSDERA
jgi:antitoxin component YwqK of YwqJK toxin-antitoxin module